MQKVPSAHQDHGDKEGVFAADKIAETAENERAERTHGETGGEGEQREDEGGVSVPRRRKISRPESAASVP